MTAIYTYLYAMLKFALNVQIKTNQPHMVLRPTEHAVLLSIPCVSLLFLPIMIAI